ncbi:MAG: hypothetical protein ACYTHK_20650, partial [Planctomycetota bacterium]
VPVSKVIPEFVFYIWKAQIETGDVDQHLALAKFSRENGLFGHAWEQYEIAAKLDPAVHTDLPKIEAKMFQEQATWIYEDAEKHFRDGDIKAARKRLDLILAKFDKSKESGRAKALISILAEREQFLTEQKRQKKVAERAVKQKRRIDKYLDFVGRADKLVLVTRYNDIYNARRRLHWAAYAYRKSYFVFDEMLLNAEVDDLRRMLKGLVEDMERRLVRTFLKLADLRWMSGDASGAMEAVHEVMAVDPANEAARGLRERILEEETVPAWERIPSYPYRRRFLGRRYMGRGRYREPYYGYWGYPYYGRHRYFSIRVR